MYTSTKHNINNMRITDIVLKELQVHCEISLKTKNIMYLTKHAEWQAGWTQTMDGWVGGWVDSNGKRSREGPLGPNSGVKGLGALGCGGDLGDGRAVSTPGLKTPVSEAPGAPNTLPTSPAAPACPDLQSHRASGGRRRDVFVVSGAPPRPGCGAEQASVDA